jgi:phage head maturation protease
MDKIFINGEVKSLKDNQFEVIASTGQMDRYGDNINPEGWFLSNYKKNPVILWAHNNTLPPVAKSIKTWVEDGKLMIKGEFAPTQFAQEVAVLVKEGFLNAVSVGFLPLKVDEKGNIDIESKMYRRMTEEEEKGMYDSEWGMKFDKQELLEVSWVDVPALPQALVTAREMGLNLITKELKTMDIENKFIEKIKEIEKSMSSMETAINTLEDSLKEVSAKSIAPTEGKRSQAPEKTKKRITPELRLLRIAIKALEQAIINEKVKAKK